MRDLVVSDVVARSKAAVDPQAAYGGHTPPPALVASPERWMQQLEVRLLELQRNESELASKVNFWEDQGIDPDKDWPIYQKLMQVRHELTWTSIRMSEVSRRVGIDNSDHLYVKFLKDVIQEHRAQTEASDSEATNADYALWAAVEGEFNF